MAGLVRRWSRESDYYYCFLVPVFSGYLLWKRREMMHFQPVRGAVWGIPLVLLAVAMRWASAYYYFALLDPLSLVPCLAGLALFLGGWKALAWSWPSTVFLVFMVPLPGFAAGLVSQPLQRIGTVAGTYMIQLVGIPTFARGNVIVLPQTELGVAEACSGLRMMMVFVTVCAAMALVMKGSVWLRLIVLFSAAPIAVVANIARITVTGILYQLVSSEIANMVFHDLAGLFMMPLAVGILLGEVELLNRLAVDPSEGPLPIQPGNSSRTSSRAPEGDRPRRRAGGARKTKGRTDQLPSPPQ